MEVSGSGQDGDIAELISLPHNFEVESCLRFLLLAQTDEYDTTSDVTVLLAPSDHNQLAYPLVSITPRKSVTSSRWEVHEVSISHDTHLTYM